MASDQDDGTRPRVAAAIPTNEKQALDIIAHERSKPGDRTYVASIVAEAIEEYLYNHWDDLPGEARDLLDEDVVANAGSGNGGAA